MQTQSEATYLDHVETNHHLHIYKTMSRKRSLTPEQEEKLKELFQQGMKQNDIARELKQTRMTVYNYVTRLFPDRKKRGMYDENATGFFCVERYKRVATI